MFDPNYLYIHQMNHALFNDAPLYDTHPLGSSSSSQSQFLQTTTTDTIAFETSCPVWCSRQQPSSFVMPTTTTTTATTTTMPTTTSTTTTTAIEPSVFPVFPSFELPLQSLQQQHPQEQQHPEQFLLFQSYFPMLENESLFSMKQGKTAATYALDASSYGSYEAMTTHSTFSNDTTPSLMSNPNFSPVASSTSCSSSTSTSPSCSDLTYWPTLHNNNNNNTCHSIPTMATVPTMTLTSFSPITPASLDNLEIPSKDKGACCEDKIKNEKKQPILQTLPPKKPVPPPQQQPRKRSYVCSICSFAFVRKHDLQRHSRVHTGVKPYSCPSCQKAFARTDALKRHLRLEIACRMDPIVQRLKQTGVRRYRNL